MNRESGKNIGRQGNEPTAAGYGIDKSGKKNQGTEHEKGNAVGVGHFSIIPFSGNFISPA
jgi:hypothetical protein